MKARETKRINARERANEGRSWQEAPLNILLLITIINSSVNSVMFYIICCCSSITNN